MIKELENKKQFTYSEVKDFIRNVFETYDLFDSYQYKERFESWLNDDGKNNNGGQCEYLEEDFFESEIESFIY